MEIEEKQIVIPNFFGKGKHFLQGMRSTVDLHPIGSRRKIAIRDFYGPNRHVYEDMLGWHEEDRIEAQSAVSRKIFEFEILYLGCNFAFYYIDNDTFYGLHTEASPIEFKILPRDRSQPYIGWQYDGDTYKQGEVLYEFEDDEIEEMWDTIKIDGKNLEDVIERSYILLLSV